MGSLRGIAYIGLFCAAFFLAWPGTAGAATLAQAESLYQLGNFRAAALAAEGLGDAAALALASRCHLVRAAYLLPHDLAIGELKAAEALARKTLALDPGNIDASLDLAIALGYRARAEGYIKAYFRGFAKEARALIAHALAAAPNDGWAAAVAGGWNAEIVLAAGPGLAASLYGARADAAIASFKRAVELDPQNTVIHLEYAKALLKLRGVDGRDAAARQLAAALAAPQPDVMAQMARQRAATLDKVLQAGGDKVAIDKVIDEIDPFAGH